MDNTEPTMRQVKAPLNRRKFVGLASAVATGAVAGTGLIGNAPAQATTSRDDLLSWLNRHAERVSTEPGGSLRDLQSLRCIARNAEVVGLGYAAHGTHTQIAVQHRMIRFLVEHMGFRTVAWEESWGSGVLIDDYVVNGGDARGVVDQAFLMLRHEAFLDLVHWIRAFNQGRPDHDKVRFLGTDVFELRGFLFDEVTRYVTDVAPDRLPELQENLYPIRMRGTPQEHVMWYLDPARPEEERMQLVAHARAVYQFVQQLTEGESTVEYLDAVQNAHAILGFYDFLTMEGTLSDAREHYIAEFLDRWKKRTDHRIVYCAHNGHIAAHPRMLMSIPDPYPGDDTHERVLAGGYLHRAYGRGYVPIGLTFGHGEVLAAWDRPEGPELFTIPQPHASFAEHTLNQVRERNFLLNLTDQDLPPVARQWLDSTFKTRIIASAYLPDNDTNYALWVDPLRQGFDAVVHVGEAEPPRMLG